MRLLRAGMLETLRLEYVVAARAKGLRRMRVLFVHVLRNAVGPLVTTLGPMLGYLVTGSFVVEHVFAIPGIGRYYVAAVLARDYPLVLGLTVVPHARDRAREPARRPRPGRSRPADARAPGVDSIP